MTVSSIQMSFSTAFVLCIGFVVIKLKRRPNNRQKTSPQGYKPQIKIQPYPGLAYLGCRHYAFRVT